MSRKERVAPFEGSMWCPLPRTIRGICLVSLLHGCSSTAPVNSGTAGGGDSNEAGGSGGSLTSAGQGGRAPHDGGGGAGSAGAAGTAASGAASGGAPEVAVFDPDGLRMRAETAMARLAQFYHPESGLWDLNDWWTSANQLETVIDYSRETGDATYADQIQNTFIVNRADDFDKWGYYDDDGWWAIAWIKAYDLTRRAEYLDMAKAIFARMTGGWDSKCGGGIYWASAKAGEPGLKNKNAIPNSLFMQVAAKLHLRTPGDAGAGSYLDWAERAWAWFEQSGMIGPDALVVDGLDNLTNCEPSGPVFTYNQGVLVGALVDLAAAKQEESLLDRAAEIAAATMTVMVSAGGVLEETPCGGDICVQFKGIFMRNLAHLYRARPDDTLTRFMRRQSDELWLENMNEQHELGYEWHLPFDKATAARQSSGLDALISAVVSSSRNLALNGAATGSAPCTADSPASFAFDGGSSTKWCSAGDGGQELNVDLGAEREVIGFRLRHAGAGGEDPAWNTRDFELELGLDQQSYARAVTHSGNTESVTTHMIAPKVARYVRLRVTRAQTDTLSPAARLYELEVFGND